MKILLALALSVAGVATGWLLKWIKAKLQLVSAENSASRRVDEVKKEIELLREQMLEEGNDQLANDRELLEEEIREQKEELKKMEAQLGQRTVLLQERESSLEKIRTAVSSREKRISEYENKMSSMKELATTARSAVMEISCAQSNCPFQSM